MAASTGLRLDGSLDARTREAQRIINNMKRWKEHPWAMIEEGMIWTIDPHDFRNPIKKFPPDPWLREVCELWMREPLLAIRKSRQLMMTWLIVYLNWWLATFHEGMAVFLQSENETKSDELIQRCEFIYNHIPATEMAKPNLKQGRKLWCLMDYPELHSYIKGIPQGQNQLRQYCASSVMMDEAAFWEKGRESFMATKPTVDGGGRVTIVSSAAKGWFRSLCFDEVA